VAEQLGLSFAELLRQLRAGAKLTQEELAEAATLSPRSVSDLERGINRTAHKTTALLLAGALGLSERARELFVAAARGKIPALEVLTAVRGAGSGPLPPGRPAYLAQVRDIAPDALIGRERELAGWAQFCVGNDPYAWWQGRPWAGKSALASWFVLHPPGGTEVVSFFITGRLYGQADSDAFLDAMVEQLDALAPADERSLARARTGAWLNLLASAAAKTEQQARRLVVVVDGLDEDDAGATPTRGRPSIASLLPRRPPPGVRFIVTSRRGPGLPDDVPIDHPLRGCSPHSLQVSKEVRGIELRAKQELRDLLKGDQVAVDVVGHRVRRWPDPRRPVDADRGAPALARPRPWRRFRAQSLPTGIRRPSRP
jgi:transcriptional regulator with XRE-family HTH domain